MADRRDVRTQQGTTDDTAAERTEVGRGRRNEQAGRGENEPTGTQAGGREHEPTGTQPGRGKKKVSTATGTHAGRNLLIILVLPYLLAVLSGCNGRDQNIEPRTLSTIADAADDDGARDALLAHQHRLFEVLSAGRHEALPQYLGLDFRFSDAERLQPAAASVGARYLPAWRERPGLNYYQFLAQGLPVGMEWEGRTMEVVWSVPSAALVVAHRNETDPVFTEWRYRDGDWKVVRLTINSSDEALRQARRSQRR
jgi:hypothetical protein